MICVAVHSLESDPGAGRHHAIDTAQQHGGPTVLGVLLVPQLIVCFD